jgi:hypothetical protein
MWCHTVTQGRGSQGETGAWSGQPVLFTLPRNMVYAALLPLMRTPRLPVVDWTDAHCRFNWTRPFRRKTKTGFWACAITFQLAYTQKSEKLVHCDRRDWRINIRMRCALLLNTTPLSQTFLRISFSLQCSKWNDIFGTGRSMKFLPPHLASSGNFSWRAHGTSLLNFARVILRTKRCLWPILWISRE